MISSLNIAEEVESKNQCIQKQKQEEKGNFFSPCSIFSIFSIPAYLSTPFSSLWLSYTSDHLFCFKIGGSNTKSFCLFWEGICFKQLHILF